MDDAAQTLQQVQDALSWATDHLKYLYSLKPGDAEYEELTDELKQAFRSLSEACSDYLTAHYYYSPKR